MTVARRSAMFSRSIVCDPCGEALNLTWQRHAVVLRCTVNQPPTPNRAKHTTADRIKQETFHGFGSATLLIHRDACSNTANRHDRSFKKQRAEAPRLRSSD